MLPCRQCYRLLLTGLGILIRLPGSPVLNGYASYRLCQFINLCRPGI